MTRSVWIIGVGSTAFARHATRTHRDLAAEAIGDAVTDATLADGSGIGSVWFASALSDYWGQSILRGQATLLPLLQRGQLPARVPIINVEAACASGSVAFQCAVREVRSGDVELSLAIGVEKLFDPTDRGRILPWFQCGQAPFDLADLLTEYRRIAQAAGAVFEPRADRSLPMDTYALQAQLHMQHHGTTARQFAAISAKNRWHASLNPKAHHRHALTTETALADKPVCGPFTRSMCAPMTDGAAAVLVASDDFLARCSPETRGRSIQVRAVSASGGKYRAVAEASLTRAAAERAYDLAGVGPEDIDLAEVHDATAYCEVFQSEMLGFCAVGEGGRLVDSGESRLGGRRPINVSGGLIGKGHPIAATGLSMVGELVNQLRGECGARQVDGARLALHQNGGGVMGLEEALCVISILERPT